jgi:lipopolysaccharide transport system ATP-binding protein
MSDIAISVENVSKMYRLGNYGTNTLGDDITRWWANVRGKEDPFSKIAETNDRSKKMDSKFVWSLNDVSFEVKKGEALGILGRNGAGKSTLLKILSRITTPTSGNIKIDGRVASLLEVGTGFNPELTGRENAYMNGAILGMNRKEVASKLDQIIDFSGVEGYIDTPVKRYSSGMFVRLAFSVAAHLNTEILILDEVLSVGDTEFQRKCANKIETICKNEGKTIIFVSHALPVVERLCNKAIYLKSGELVNDGYTDDIVPIYLKDIKQLDLQKEIKVEIVEEETEEETEEVAEIPIEVEPPQVFLPELFFDDDIEKQAQIKYMALKDSKGDVATMFNLFDEIYLELEYTLRKPFKGISLTLMVSKNNSYIFRTDDIDEDQNLLLGRDVGNYRSVIKFPDFLKSGLYDVELLIGEIGVGRLDAHKNVLPFQITEENIDTSKKSYAEFRQGQVRTKIQWQNEKISNG